MTRGGQRIAWLLRQMPLLVAGPYVALFGYVLLRTRITMPASDMIAWLSDYLDWRDGQRSTLQYLWAWHNEHHLVWIRLLTALDAACLGAHGLAFVAAATMALLATACVIAREGGCGGGRAQWPGALPWLAPMLVLGAAGAVDCAVPVDAVYPLALVCAVSALVLFDGREAQAGRIFARRLAALCAAVAAGLANGVGLVVWPALFWCAWKGGAARGWLSAIAAVACAYAVLYLHGLPGVAASPLAAGHAITIWQRLSYGAAFMGLPFSSSAATITAGRVAGIAAAVACVSLIINNSLVPRRLARRDRLGTGFLILSCGAAVLAALGRADAASGAVLPLRYTVLLIPLHVGLLWLAIGLATRQVALRKLASAGGAGLAVMLLVQQAVLGESKVRAQARWNQIIAQYYDGQVSADMVPVIFPDLQQAHVITARMRRAGLLDGAYGPK